MQKIALAFLSKNDGQDIMDILHSATQLVDLIIAVDVDSRGCTRELILSYGSACGIPTYVFTSPFGESPGSRHYALKKMEEVVKSLFWDLREVWGLWMESGESVMIDEKFDKKRLHNDIYFISGKLGDGNYPGKHLFKLSAKLSWFGPTLETLLWAEPSITIGWQPQLEINFDEKGDSWKAAMASKYKQYAFIHADYMNQKGPSFKMTFLTAEYFKTAAAFENTGAEQDRLYQEAMIHYNEVLSTKYNPLPEHRYYAQLEICSIMEHLGVPWLEIEEALLKAHALYPEWDEAVKRVINHYIWERNWARAYIFTKFAKTAFIQRSEFNKRGANGYMLFQHWDILELHSIVCIGMDRKEEALVGIKEMNIIAREYPEFILKH